MPFTVECPGLEGLVQRLNELPERIASFVNTEVHQIGETMVQEMRSNAPVDTGFLRDNIGITDSSPVAVQVASLAYYSVFVEFGTSKMEAQEFFFPVAGDPSIGVDKFIEDFKSTILI